ncbi:T9SS type A sorting domain-containing protein [Aquimarina rhabdastrellae]
MKKIVFFILILFNINSFSQDYMGSHRNLTIYNNELWLYGRSIASDNIWKSADGLNWQEVASDINHNNGAVGIAFKGELYSIGGAGTNEVKTSTDGITWTTNNANFSSKTKPAAVVHNNELYVLGGSGSNDVWSTSDGSNWVQKTNTIATDFPHFWSPKVVSLNGKLILFGGNKTDFAFEKNTRGVYISSDDGVTWQRHQFPLPVDLSTAGNYAVYENKLWIIVEINPNYLYNEGEPFLSEKRLFWTEDGVTWHQEPNSESDFIENDNLSKSKSIAFNNKLFNYKRSGGTGVSIASFQIPNIVLPIINAQLIKQSEAQQTFNFPFNYDHKISGNRNNITFSYASSDRTIIKTDAIDIVNNELHIKPTGKVGHTIISIIANDGGETEVLQIQFYIYPDQENIWISQPNNILIDVNGNLDTQPFRSLEFNNYGTNSFEFSSSNTVFKADRMTASSHSFVPNLNFMFFNDALDTSTQSETEVTIIATDGVTRFSRKFWVKVGANQDPQIQRTLDIYNSPTKELNYQIPNDAFRDPEGESLIYSIQDLPNELNLDPITGIITGTLLNTSYTITITAIDKYSGKVSQDLIINRDTTLSTLDITSNIDNTLQLFPNPSNGNFNLAFKATNTDNVSIKLFDLKGQLLRQEQYNNVNNQFSEKLNFNELNAGLYLLQIQNGSERAIRKIIVN